MNHKLLCCIRYTLLLRFHYKNNISYWLAFCNWFNLNKQARILPERGTWLVICVYSVVLHIDFLVKPACESKSQVVIWLMRKVTLNYMSNLSVKFESWLISNWEPSVNISLLLSKFCLWVSQQSFCSIFSTTVPFFASVCNRKLKAYQRKLLRYKSL